LHRAGRRAVEDVERPLRRRPAIDRHRFDAEALHARTVEIVSQVIDGAFVLRAARGPESLWFAGPIWSSASSHCRNCSAVMNALSSARIAWRARRRPGGQAVAPAADVGAIHEPNGPAPATMTAPTTRNLRRGTSRSARITADMLPSSLSLLLNVAPP